MENRIYYLELFNEKNQRYENLMRSEDIKELERVKDFYEQGGNIVRITDRV